MPRTIKPRADNVVNLDEDCSITFRVATWREQRASAARVLMALNGVYDGPEIDWDLLMTCAESFTGFVKVPKGGGDTVPCEFPADLESVLRSLSLDEAAKCLAGLKEQEAEPALHNLKSGLESPEVGVDSVVGAGAEAPVHEDGGGPSDPRNRDVEKSRVGTAG